MAVYLVKEPLMRQDYREGGVEGQEAAARPSWG